MKIIHNVIIAFVLVMSSAVFAMDCGICYESISADRPSVTLCPKNACKESNPICKECHTACLKKSQTGLPDCPFCTSLLMGTCIACDKNFIQDNKVIDARFCRLDCGHGICYTCIKDHSTYACACGKVHNVDATKEIKKPSNSGKAKEVLRKHIKQAEEAKKQTIKNTANKKTTPNNFKNCPVCRQDQDPGEFCAVGCKSQHEFCITCLPKWLNTHKTCPACFEPVSDYAVADYHARKKGHAILPSQMSIVRQIGAIGISFCIAPWIAHSWSKYRLYSSLNTLNQTAQAKITMLLNFEFDRDDTALLGLEESLNVNQLMNALAQEKRETLQQAIQEYDVALRNAYNRIVSAYYYQPAANFIKKEPILVQNLKICGEEVKKLTTQYMQELGNPMRNMLLGMGAGLLSGAGLLYATKYETLS